MGMQLQDYYANKTLEKEASVYCPDPLDFVTEKSGGVYYGKRLLFIERLHDASPGVANLDAYIHYLTLLLSTKHLAKRLKNQDNDNLSQIIKDATIWLNKEQSSSKVVNTKQYEVKQQAHKIIWKLLLLPFRRLKFISKNLPPQL